MNIILFIMDFQDTFQSIWDLKRSNYLACWVYYWVSVFVMCFEIVTSRVICLGTHILLFSVFLCFYNVRFYF